MLTTGLVEPYLNRLRNIVGDKGETFLSSQVADGLTSRWDIPYERIDGASLSVRYLSGFTLIPGVDYIVQEEQGVINTTVVVPNAETLVVSGLHYRYFTTADYLDFIDISFIEHTHNRFDQAGIPLNFNTLPPIEINLIAIRASMEVYWDLATDASTDIDVLTPEGMHIPSGQRFSQLLQMIQVQESRYRELCEQLNVGLARIEMFSLRRVSRLTNRLVPIYRSREVDDSFTPQRIMPPIDTMGDVMITFRGLWTSTFIFSVNDETEFNGQRYLCTKSNAGIQPDLDTTNNYWRPTAINAGRYYG